jgi:hypothetical protein
MTVAEDIKNLRKIAAEARRLASGSEASRNILLVLAETHEAQAAELEEQLRAEKGEDPTL